MQPGTIAVGGLLGKAVEPFAQHGHGPAELTPGPTRVERRLVEVTRFGELQGIFVGRRIRASEAKRGGQLDGKAISAGAFGAGDVVEERILESVASMPEQFRVFVRDTLSYVENVNYTALSGIGLALLLWLVVQVLGRVEWSFNKVWGISASRPLLRKFSDYLSFLVVVPALMLAATAINTTLSSEAFVGLMQTRLGPAAFLYKRLLLLMPWLITRVTEFATALIMSASQFD